MIALRHSGIRCIKADNQVAFFGSAPKAPVCLITTPSNHSCVNYREQQGNGRAFPSNMVRDILLPGDGQVWVGTREGLSILQEGKFSTYIYDKYSNDGLTFNSVRHLMKDRAGNIWMGTYAGGVNIFYAESRNFNNISEQVGQRPGLSERMLSSMLRNDDGSFWLGTEGGGLNLMDM
jgi:ligand-binding sensor domain-containing protein